MWRVGTRKTRGNRVRRRVGDSHAEGGAVGMGKGRDSRAPGLLPQELAWLCMCQDSDKATCARPQ